MIPEPRRTRGQSLHPAPDFQLMIDRPLPSHTRTDPPAQPPISSLRAALPNPHALIKPAYSVNPTIVRQSSHSLTNHATPDHRPGVASAPHCTPLATRPRERSPSPSPCPFPFPRADPAREHTQPQPSRGDAIAPLPLPPSQPYEGAVHRFLVRRAPGWSRALQFQSARGGWTDAVWQHRTEAVSRSARPASEAVQQTLASLQTTASGGLTFPSSPSSPRFHAGLYIASNSPH